MQREGVANVVNWLIISIHAPLTGCDSMVYIGFFNHQYFNPRTHRGVRHSDRMLMQSDDQISIHAPIVGCDMAYILKQPITEINFNPRTHRGVRPLASTLLREL